MYYDKYVPVYRVYIVHRSELKHYYALWGPDRHWSVCSGSLHLAADLLNSQRSPAPDTTTKEQLLVALMAGFAGIQWNSAINPTIIMWKVYIKIKELAIHLKNSTQPYCQRPTCIWHLCQAKPWLKGASLDFPEALRICLRTPPPIFVQVPDMLLQSSLWQPFRTCLLRGVDT